MTTESSKRVIPFTPPGPLWSQREYVACVSMDVAFTAHRHGEVDQAFHYAFPDDIGCTTVIVSAIGVEKYIDHDHKRTSGWINRSVEATKEKT